MRNRFGVVVLALGLLAGCTSSPADDGGERESLTTIPAAEPAVAPLQTAALEGSTVTVGADVRAMVVDPTTRTLVLLAAGPDRLVLLDLDDEASPGRTVELSGGAAAVELAGEGGAVLVGLAEQVLRVDTATGRTTSLPVDGDVTAVRQLADGTVAAGTSDGRVVLLGADGQVQRTVDGFAGVDEILEPGGELVVLDRQQTAVRTVDRTSGELREALRAGDGAAEAVTDRFERALVTDTTAGALLAYTAGPLLLRQRFPVPDAPYALAYDPVTDLAWVTLTATNEVVGLDVAAGEPVERYRFATVTQPNSVAVDSATGTVLVGSATGEGVQRIVPGAPS